MENISLTGESINLLRGKSYVVIDGLHINTIRDEFIKLDKSNLEKEIRERIFSFPRTDTPFAILDIPISGKLNSILNFSIKWIKKANQYDKKNICFDTDTGLLVFIDKLVLLEFILDFDYDKLVDSTLEPINSEYWNLLYNKFGQYKIALVLAPGIDSGFEFVGSGTYKIQNQIFHPDHLS